MNRVVSDSDVRVHLEDCKGKFNIPLFNGSRRFFNKQNKKALSKNSKLAALIIKEYQMGHGGLVKLDRNYFKEQVEELIEEYLLAIPMLTIDSAVRKQTELEQERKKNSELEKKNEENQLVKDEVFRQGKFIENLQKQIKELNTKQQNSN